MALRDQPYIPLYVQDFLTDEKLIECSAEATGVYIRLMCILHKSEEYGKILLKQKDKQGDNQVKNFASKLLKQMPFTLNVIEKSLQELINEQVLLIDNDYLYQKRMVRDNDISLKRSESGKRGGEKTQFASKFALAKIKANTEYEIECENVSELLLNEILKRKPDFKQPDLEKWSTHIDLMIRVDKRSSEEIKKVIIWCQQDQFWQNNILSTEKLRKQFDQLSLKMTGDKKPKQLFIKQESPYEKCSRCGHEVRKGYEYINICGQMCCEYCPESRKKAKEDLAKIPGIANLK